MPDWTCPDCGGGFPESAAVGGMSATLTCPWCTNQGIDLAPNMPASLPGETP
jgi:hypothetical protein